MKTISSADFSSTVTALDAYSRQQTISESANPIFILKREGNKLLFIDTDSLSTIQKILRFFGFGGYRLCDFVNLLQSEEFCNTLKATPLNAKTRTTLEAALSTLDRKVSNYNLKPSTKKITLLFFEFTYFIRPTITLKYRRLIHIVSAYVTDASRDEYITSHKACQVHPYTIPVNDQLLADINAGRAVIKNPVSFEEKRAYVHQEVIKLNNIISHPDTDLLLLAFDCVNEPYFSEKLPRIFTEMATACNAISEETIRNLSFSQLKDHLFTCKIEPWLDLSSIPEEARSNRRDALRFLREQHVDITRFVDTEIVSIQKFQQDPNIPPLFKEYLISEIKEMSRAAISKDLFLTLTSLMFSLDDTTITPFEFEIKALFHISLIKNLTFDVKATFITKWAPYLAKEMIQNIVSQRDKIAEGICHGISKRYVRQHRENLELPLPQLLELMEFGTIKASDRFHQALHNLDAKNRPIKKGKAFFFSQPFSTKEEAQKQIKIMIDNAEWQNNYRAVGYMKLAFETGFGHAITIIAHKNNEHPEKSIFRIFDCNYGAFDFPVSTNGVVSAEAKFIDCLSDRFFDNQERLCTGFALYE